MRLIKLAMTACLWVTLLSSQVFATNLCAQVFNSRFETTFTELPLPTLQQSLQAKNSIVQRFFVRRALSQLRPENFTEGVTDQVLNKAAAKAYDSLTSKWWPSSEDVAAEKWIERQLFEKAFQDFISNQALKDPGFRRRIANRISQILKTPLVQNVWGRFSDKATDPVLIAAFLRDGYEPHAAQVTESYRSSGQRNLESLRKAVSTVAVIMWAVATAHMSVQAAHDSQQRVSDLRVQQIEQNLSQTSAGLDRLNTYLAAKGYYKN